jgi:hypothetical protein
VDNPKEQGYPQSHTCLDNATRCPHIHSLRRCKRLIFQRSKDLKDKKTVRWISIFPAFSFKWITIFLASVDQYFSGAWITFFLTIADEPVEEIIKLYTTFEKQIFIAFDKDTAYSDETSKILNDSKVIQLDEGGNELFGRSWNIKD